MPFEAGQETGVAEADVDAVELNEEETGVALEPAVLDEVVVF